MGLNSTDDSREGIEKYLKRNPTSSFIAECDGKTIGVIMAGHDDPQQTGSCITLHRIRYQFYLIHEYFYSYIPNHLNLWLL